MQANLAGELRDSPTVNIIVTAEWRQVQQVITGALAKYPDARRTVALPFPDCLAVRLSSSLAMALDPVVLAEHAGLTPDPWQARVLRSEAPQHLMLCSRQAGKGTTAGLLAVAEAIHQAISLVLLLAAALRQSSELFRSVKPILRPLGDSRRRSCRSPRNR